MPSPEPARYSLDSFNGGLYGIIWGSTIRVIKEDTWSLDYSSNEVAEEAHGREHADVQHAHVGE